jgi:hypothetical protein
MPMSQWEGANLRSTQPNMVELFEGSRTFFAPIAPRIYLSLDSLRPVPLLYV